MKNKILIFILMIMASKTLASGTVVGNGGDPLFEFLSATRSSLIETARKEFCISSALSQEQISFCQDFALKTIEQVIRLNDSLMRTPFVLKEEVLKVRGPDGKEMQVSARTELGPHGVIEFHRDSLKTMAPTQVLFLLAHEFQHKVHFNDRYISDNESIAPFASGRDLIDTVATAYVKLARSKGLIGTQFGIRDIFDCKVSSSGSQFGARISSSRLFLSEDLMSYQTSVGKNPADGSIYIPEAFDSSIGLKFEINEPKNCQGWTEETKSLMQVVRLTKTSFGTKEDILAFRSFDFNPICAESSSRALFIEWNQNSFTCLYYGSVGTTASPYSTLPNPK